MIDYQEIEIVKILNNSTVIENKRSKTLLVVD